MLSGHVGDLYWRLSERACKWRRSLLMASIRLDGVERRAFVRQCLEIAPGNSVDSRSAKSVLGWPSEICTGNCEVHAHLYQCDYVSDFKFLIGVVAGWV